MVLSPKSILARPRSASESSPVLDRGRSGREARLDRPPAGRGMRTGPILAACLALAALSLLVPVAPAYDAWGWLVWGREVAGLELDTTAGPSWKPFPVLFTTVFSLFGGAAPELWLVIGRAGALLALVLVYRLASRLAGPVAGAIAAPLLLLTPSEEARLIRHIGQGNVEPLLVALVLWALERHLDGHRGHALALGTCAAFVRPEAWPFLALYGLWLWAAEPRLRPFVAGAAALVPVLWFGGDWWGSGDPFTGGERAQVAGDLSVGGRVELAASTTFQVVMVPVWVSAAVAVALAARARDRLVPLLAAAALAWLAIVAAMTITLGYAALPRFLDPAAALLCVLAGVGAVGAVRSASRRRLRFALAAVLVAASLPFALPRIAALGDQVDVLAERTRLQTELRTAAREAGGAPRVLSCGQVAVDMAEEAIESPVALAWELAAPFDRVSRWLGPESGYVFALRGGERERRLLREGGEARRVAGNAEWTVFAVRCPGG